MGIVEGSITQVNGSSSFPMSLLSAERPVLKSLGRAKTGLTSRGRACVWVTSHPKSLVGGLER